MGCLCKVNGICFATATAPYREKQCSAIMAMALDLRRDIRAADLGTSLKSGTTAGAAAAVLCRADMAKDFRKDPVYIKAMQICTGPSSGRLLQDYHYTHVQEAHRAGSRTPRPSVS